MSDTPRTDGRALIYNIAGACPLAWAKHREREAALPLEEARTLERELSTALATIAARDSRIAEQQSAISDAALECNQLRRELRNRCDECGAKCITDCPECGAPNCCPQCCKIDTAARELAEAKAEIERLREQLHIIPKPRPMTTNVNAAHDTLEPSVERPELPASKDIFEALSRLFTLAGAAWETTGDPTDIRTAYEIDCVRERMEELYDAQAESCDIFVERDQLKAENEKLRQEQAAFNNSTGLEKALDTLGAKEASRLQSENEKLRALVAAKDEALRAVEWTQQRAGYETIRIACPNCKGLKEIGHNKCCVLGNSLSPEIANGFVRREVLETLAQKGKQMTKEFPIDWKEYPEVRDFLSALSRVENELKGKQL